MASFRLSAAEAGKARANTSKDARNFVMFGPLWEEGSGGPRTITGSRDFSTLTRSPAWRGSTVGRCHRDGFLHLETRLPRVNSQGGPMSRRLSRRSILSAAGALALPVRAATKVPAAFDHMLLGCGDLEKGIAF